MKIAKFLREHVIDSALHFTTNRGLVGAFAVGKLLSRSRLSNESLLEYVLHVNAARRPEAAADFDKSENWLDYVNLSISEINTRFHEVSKRWHNSADVWWCILEFDSEILEHEGVYFATTNNSYELCQRGTGIDGLQALFADRVGRKEGWSVSRRGRPPHLPTCEQAKVLYPKSVSLDHLRRIYVQDAEHYDAVGGWLLEFDRSGVDVKVSRKKFGGQPN